MFTLVMAVASCDSDDDAGFENPLLGTWEASESEIGMTVELTARFNSNETGEFITTLLIGDQVVTNENFDFTWSTDGDKLTMTMDGETDISTYSVSGDKLTITDSDGEVIVLKRL